MSSPKVFVDLLHLKMKLSQVVIAIYGMTLAIYVICLVCPLPFLPLLTSLWSQPLNGQ